MRSSGAARLRTAGREHDSAGGLTVVRPFYYDEQRVDLEPESRRLPHLVAQKALKKMDQNSCLTVS
jgi:hypothetical protein